MKFLIQDLVLFSSHLSLLSIKKEGKTIGFINKKKLISFYQKFKKILKKNLSIPKRIFFMMHIIKIEIFYTEDKITFIENELTDIRGRKTSWVALFLIFNLLCRYYIFVDISPKKNNWGNQCAIVGKKKKHSKKNKFIRLVFELTQIHLNKKIRSHFCLNKMTEKQSFFVIMFNNFWENENFTKRIQNLLCFHSILKKKDKKKKQKKIRHNL